MSSPSSNNNIPVSDASNPEKHGTASPPTVFVPYPPPRTESVVSSATAGESLAPPAPVFPAEKAQIYVDGTVSGDATAKESASSDPSPNAHHYTFNPAGTLRNFSLRRTFSRMSKRSYISNLSVINKANLLRFGRNKITFLVVNSIFTLAALTALVFALLVWFGGFQTSPIIKYLRPDILILITTFGAVQFVVSILGFFGAFRHDKPSLTIYSVLIWVVLALILAASYLAYKEVNDNMYSERIRSQWSKNLNNDQKSFVQNQFQCCGYYSDADLSVSNAQCQGPISVVPSDTTDAAAALSKRSVSALMRLFKRQEPKNILQTLPGCAVPLQNFVIYVYTIIYDVGFATIPVCLFAFLVGILASNHIYND